MERDRNKKLVIIAVLAIALSMTIGFAAFSNTLNIASNASVSPNSDTFSVKFSTKQDSLDEGAVKTSYASTGVISADGMISNVASPTLTNLSATFTEPGQYVEYTVYARNEGRYKAYLNNVNFIGEKTCTATAGSGATASLVEAACRSINMIVKVGNQTYTSTTAISGHALEPNKGEKVVVRIGYDEAGARADGRFSIKFGDVTMVYSTVDDSTYEPPTTPENTQTLNYIMKRAAQSDAGVDFSQAPVAGVYTVNSTIGNTNPIYYYRGPVTNNNVLFANKCWKVVRTTETGGVKLIYNGTPTDGQCLGTNPTIGGSSFNVNYESESDVRYLYENGTNSTIKGVVDTWYKNNMTAYTSNLEDTPWCMDLSSRTDATNGTIYYGAYDRIYENPIEPSLLCSAEHQLKVSAADVGLKLKYPIALLTADEITMAGLGISEHLTNVFLKSDYDWWSLSPYNFFDSFAHVFYVNGGGTLDLEGVVNDYGVRPAVSLAPGTEVTGSGDGTAENPYVVK